jgi:hypothetical protein
MTVTWLGWIGSLLWLLWMIVMGVYLIRAHLKNGRLGCFAAAAPRKTPPHPIFEIASR